MSDWLYQLEYWPVSSSDNEGLLHIPQSSRTGVSSSDGLVSYPGHSLEEMGQVRIKK